MIDSKYGGYSSTQIHSVKLQIRKSIFFLLLYVDPATSKEYSGVNVVDAFHSLQYKLDGLNSILRQPPELIETMSLLEAALIEFQSEDFFWPKYRKLILDAGSRIMDIREDGD